MRYVIRCGGGICYAIIRPTRGRVTFGSVQRSTITVGLQATTVLGRDPLSVSGVRATAEIPQSILLSSPSFSTKLGFCAPERHQRARVSWRATLLGERQDPHEGQSLILREHLRDL